LKTALLYGGGWPLGVVLVLNAFVLTMVCQRLGAAICLRPVLTSNVESWAEKARLAYPVWWASTAGVFVLGVLSFVPAVAFDKQLSFPGARWLPLLCAATSFLATSLGNARVESRLKGRVITVGDRCRALLIGCLIFLLHFLALFWLAVSMPDQFTPLVWIFVAIGCLVITFCIFAGGLFVTRLLGIARPAPERLERLVALAVQRVGVRPKATYLIRWSTANAIAFPFVQRIAVTDTALKYLTDEELVAVIVHELAHLNESPRVKRLRAVGGFVWLPLICAKPILGTYGFPALAATALLVLCGHSAVRHLSRAMERRADTLSQTNEGEPGTYAKALEHIYELNLIPAVTRQKMSTHPHLYDRLVAAGMNPAYPRPRPPTLWRAAIAVVVMSLCALLYVVIFGGVLTLILR
jgi:Zn-dependent protease with chaperone function